MPRLQDIERFKKDLTSLAHEPEVLAQWGEKQADIPVPEGANDDAAIAASRAGRKPARPSAPPRAEQAPGPAASSEDELPPDFETLLADLPLDQEESEASGREKEKKEGQSSEKTAAEPEELQEEPEEAEELPEEPEAFENENAGTAETQAAGEPAGAQSGEAPAAFDSDNFSIPDLDSSAVDLGGKAESADTAAKTPASSEEPAGDSGAFSLDDLGSMENPGGAAAPEDGAAASAGAQGTPAAENGGKPDAEEVSSVPDLPDLDAADLGTDFGAGAETTAGAEGAEPAAPEPAEAGAGGPQTAAAAGVPESPAGAPAAPSGEAAPDDFSIPDLNDFNLDETPADMSAKQGGGTAEAGASAAPSGEPAAPKAAPSSGSLDLGGETKDSFDSFSFGGAAGGSGAEDFDKELAALGTETAPASTFNLDKEWETGFEIPGAESGTSRTAREAPHRTSAKPQQEKVREVSLSDAQFDRLQDRLLALPLNLRVAIEQIIAQEQGEENQRAKLVWMLVDGAPLKDIAAAAGRILNKRISIPEGFEKRSGAEFEAEKGSFRYVLIHTVLPAARTVLLALLAAGVLIFLGYESIYKPLSANSLYRQGYSLIGEDRYDEANSDFSRASAIKDYKNWYYQYARAFAGKRQYTRAEDKYRALLRRYPKEANGALEWAALEHDIGRYSDAVKVLRNYLLNYDYFNKDALMLEGNIYLDWADQDPKHYDDARRSFTALLSHYGEKDEFLEGMLLYYIRTDNFKGVRKLFTHFMDSNKPYPKATSLAELAGYLMDRGTIEGVYPVLSAALAKDAKAPEVHYQFSRYYHKIEDSSRELKALDAAIRHFEEKPILSDRQFPLYLDSLIWRGNCYSVQKEYISAEEDYRRAAEKYDDALKNPSFKPSARFAAAYAGLAEVAFWQRNDLANALLYYERAARDGYDTPDTRYRRAFIYYSGGDYKSALEQFYMAGRDGSESPYLVFAFGNAFYMRGDYHAAESYYRRTVDQMQYELQNISNPDPQNRRSQSEIVTLLMKAQNNLGVAEYRVADRSGDASLRAQGMFAFSESMRLYDSLERDQISMDRPQSKAPSYINMDTILHPVRGQDLVIYNEIPRDMTFPAKIDMTR